MTGISKSEGIEQVFEGGGHVVILGAGASIASNIRNPEKNGKQLPSMDNFINIVGLKDILHEIPEELRADNFEELYSNLHSEDHSSDILSEIEARIQSYFGNMTLPNEATIYDHLILSLRDKDLIATFNWDPFLYQAWSRNRKFTKNQPYLSFLHGCVTIGYSDEDDVSGPVGMQARPDGGLFKPSKLLYPVRQKNYSNDKYISQEWERLRYWLGKESGTVRTTIFGYGAPISDAEAVKIMNEAWGTPDHRDMEQFEIINVESEEVLRTKWDSFIHSHHYDITNDYFHSSLALNPRRTSESYFCHYEPMTPAEAFRHSNPIPNNITTLDQLWKWHEPLIEAEIKSGKS